jgi:hypothetical protein
VNKKIKVNNILFIPYVIYLVYILNQFLTVPHVSKWNTISIITWLAIFHNIYTELAGYHQLSVKEYTMPSKDIIGKPR